MPLIRVRGVEIYYSFRRRVGPDVIMVHGAGGNHLNWYYQIEHLPFTTIAPDLPGHGKSGGKPSTNIEDYALIVAEFLKSSPGDKVLMGHSLGGHIVLKTVEMGYRPRGVVLVSSTARLPELKPPESPEKFCSNMFYSPDHVERCLKTANQILSRNRESLEADLKAAGSDVSFILRNLKIPVLFIYGTKDRLLDRKEIERTIGLVPAAKAYFVSAGHMVMIEKFKKVNRILTEWIRELGFPSQL